MWNGCLLILHFGYGNVVVCYEQGFVMNMQPSEAEAGFDVRLPPTVDSDLIRKKISEEWAPAVRNMTYTVNDSL